MKALYHELLVRLRAAVKLSENQEYFVMEFVREVVAEERVHAALGGHERGYEEARIKYAKQDAPNGKP